MRINQREGDWERSNLSFLALGFPFFFLFVIGASGFREEKRVWKKKGDEKQNNTIRMLLDSFVLVVDFFFFFLFPPEMCPLRRGGESSVPQDTT